MAVSSAKGARFQHGDMWAAYLHVYMCVNHLEMRIVRDEDVNLNCTLSGRQSLKITKLAVIKKLDYNKEGCQCSNL